MWLPLSKGAVDRSVRVGQLLIAASKSGVVHSGYVQRITANGIHLVRQDKVELLSLHTRLLSFTVLDPPPDFELKMADPTLNLGDKI